MAENQDNIVARVTGGSSGIGRPSALAFAPEGMRLVVADIGVEGGQATLGLSRAGGTSVLV